MAQLSRVFNALNNQPGYRSPIARAPMLNTLTRTWGSYLSEVGQIRKKKSLMAWFKAIPELTALTRKVVKDVVQDYHFEPVNPTESGRNRILAANKFSKSIEQRKIMFSQALDIIVTGEGFGWKGKISKEEVNEELNKIKSRYILLEKNEMDYIRKEVLSETKQFMNEDGFVGALDEDATLMKKYNYIASTTMEVLHDQQSILGYSHIVGTEQIKFEKDEIIRYTFENVDGKVNGFTPVESIIVQLELLRQMWQNMMSIYKNGGSPDKLFILENTRVNDPAYKRIEEQLKKYKLVENKHGNMVFTGKVTVEDLQQLDQMQFKDMGLYITGLMAMQWEIPKSSIPYILGGTNTKDDTGGNSEKGYWKNIKFFQESFAETMNTQLWIPYFGVKIVFDNQFVQGEVQEQTMLNLKLTNVKSMDEILMKDQKKLNIDKRLKLLGLTEQDVDKFELEDNPMMMGGVPNPQGQLSDSEVNDSQAKRNKAGKKREEQLSTISSRGMAPTGVGKEFDEHAELEYKSILGEDTMDISMDQFITLYGRERMKIGEPPRIFMRQNPDITSFIFKGVDFIYKAAIGTDSIDSYRIKLLNLGTEIFRL